MDKVLWVSLGLLVLFAWFDSKNLVAIKKIDSLWQNCQLWKIFGEMISPAVFTMWVGVLAAIGVIWYLYTNDKSEAWALFLTPAILIIFGVQDLIYYVISPDNFGQSIGCWANALVPVRIVSDFMGETCPTTRAFLFSAVLGIGVAYYVYNYLKRR